MVPCCLFSGVETGVPAARSTRPSRTKNLLLVRIRILPAFRQPVLEDGCPQFGMLSDKADIAVRVRARRLSSGPPSIGTWHNVMIEDLRPKPSDPVHVEDCSSRSSYRLVDGADKV